MNSFVKGFGVIDSLDQAGCKLPNGTKRRIALGQALGQGHKKGGPLGPPEMLFIDCRLLFLGVVAGRLVTVLVVAELSLAILHRGFARQLDAALVVHADALDPDFVAVLDDVLGLLDAEVGQLADVHQAVLARQHLDETAEVLDGNNLAPVKLANLDLGGDAVDALLGHLQTLG